MHALMRGTAVSLLLLLPLCAGPLLLPGPGGAAHALDHAPAEDAHDDAAEAIRAVIRAQLAAFRRDDGPAAFSYAAPSVQQMFGTPERFMTMVRQGYHPVYRPRQVIFQALLVHQQRWVQPLLVTTADGAVLVALYTMERQRDATWRISGVVLVPSAAQGA